MHALRARDTRHPGRVDEGNVGRGRALVRGLGRDHRVANRHRAPRRAVPVVPIHLRRAPQACGVNEVLKPAVKVCNANVRAVAEVQCCPGFGIRGARWRPRRFAGPAQHVVRVENRVIGDVPAVIRDDGVNKRSGGRDRVVVVPKDVRVRRPVVREQHRVVGAGQERPAAAARELDEDALVHARVVPLPPERHGFGGEVVNTGVRPHRDFLRRAVEVACHGLPHGVATS